VVFRERISVYIILFGTLIRFFSFEKIKIEKYYEISDHLGSIDRQCQKPEGIIFVSPKIQSWEIQVFKYFEKMVF